MAVVDSFYVLENSHINIIIYSHVTGLTATYKLLYAFEPINNYNKRPFIAPIVNNCNEYDYIVELFN